MHDEQFIDNFAAIAVEFTNASFKALITLVTEAAWICQPFTILSHKIERIICAGACVAQRK